jgi:hypothetical protein
MDINETLKQKGLIYLFIVFPFNNVLNVIFIGIPLFFPVWTTSLPAKPLAQGGSCRLILAQARL